MRREVAGLAAAAVFFVVRAVDDLAAVAAVGAAAGFVAVVWLGARFGFELGLLAVASVFAAGAFSSLIMRPPLGG